MSVDWDAESYHRLAAPQEEMGLAVLGRLRLRGDETVLDAGCGTGRVTAHLVERLPLGRVIAVDLSADMVAQARASLGDRAEVRQADLLELDVTEPVDAVFSTATFHWILDHDRLFRQLYSVLRPGGRLVAQCGGRGNISRVLTAAAAVGREFPFEPAFEGWTRASYFAGDEETAQRLEHVGFVGVRCWLEERPVPTDDPVSFLTTITLRDHMTRIALEHQREFAERVAARLGDPVVLDYVRLNVEAQRPAS